MDSVDVDGSATVSSLFAIIDADTTLIIADRNSLRNFWQHNYLYAWVGGRVVYDA